MGPGTRIRRRKLQIPRTLDFNCEPGYKTHPAPTRHDVFPGGFTVLMAVYGRDDPQLFERAVESVYQNTIVPDDFVLVVDGPTPPDLEHVIQRCTNEHGIRTFRLPQNVGLASALNHGLPLVRTAWVARADADDINLPDRFQRQGEAIRRMSDQVDLLGGAVVEVDKGNAPLATREVPLKHHEIVGRLGKRNPFNHMTVTYRTANVIEVGGYPDIHLKEDYALWASMIARGARCANLSAVLVRATTARDMYRRRGGLRYAKSEWDLQVHLFKLGHKGLFSAIFFGCVRASVSLLPAGFRGWIYERLLRKRPK
jgi:glycosyltransferase involved in cell wall biosynthesis